LVAEALGFRYTPVHRRMKGEVAWELEEIEKVAAHFGETFASVFAPPRESDYLAAVLLADGTRGASACSIRTTASSRWRPSPGSPAA